MVTVLPVLLTARELCDRYKGGKLSDVDGKTAGRKTGNS